MSQENVVQAVLLAAGTGSKMLSIIGENSKCTMPVGHFPMIYYPLKYLEKNHFSEVTVIVSKSQRDVFRAAVSKLRLKIKVRCVLVDTEDEPLTGETLRLVQNQIKEDVLDVLVMSCDLITNVEFSKMYTHHVEKNANLTVLLGSSKIFPLKFHPSDKLKHFKNKVISTRGEKKLVQILSPCHQNQEVPQEVYDNCGPRMYSSKHTDQHMYIIKRQALRYLLHPNAPCHEYSSLKDELIPHLVACQFPESIDEEPGQVSIDDFEEDWKESDMIAQKNTCSLDDKPFGHKNFCTTFTTTKFCVRVNTYSNFWYLNSQVLSKLYTELGLEYKTTGKKMNVLQNVKKPKGKKFIEAALGDNVTIEDDVQIKNSFIADNVTIPSGCRIDDSVVLVSLESPVNLNKCIVSDWSLLMEYGDLHTYRDLIA